MFKSAIKILEEIEKYGFKSYIVGGYVRDKYINKKSSDVDVSTNATPKDLKKIFPTLITNNEQYGSVTLIYNKIRFEITTFRKELKYIDNRLPIKIKYIDSLEEDLKRRDFTMNTMCINKRGEVLDLMKASTDIDEKIIRTVGSPRIKLKEDSLRILRAIRFSTTLDFKLENNLEKYIVRYKKLLLKLSYNRKKEELDKIFTSSNNQNGIKTILNLNLEEVLELKNLKNIKITNDAIGIWAQLGVEDKYPFTKNEIQLMKNIRKVKDFSNFSLYNFGLYVCQVAAEIKGISKKDIRKNYMNLPIKTRKDINISTNDICSILNIKPSAVIKKIYFELENKILKRELENNFESIKNYLLTNQF